MHFQLRVPCPVREYAKGQGGVHRGWLSFTTISASLKRTTPVITGETRNKSDGGK
jgi:hypothetical protein